MSNDLPIKQNTDDGSYREQKNKVREEQHDFELWLQSYILHSQCVSQLIQNWKIIPIPVNTNWYMYAIVAVLGYIMH